MSFNKEIKEYLNKMGNVDIDIFVSGSDQPELLKKELEEVKEDYSNLLKAIAEDSEINLTKEASNFEKKWGVPDGQTAEFLLETLLRVDTKMLNAFCQGMPQWLNAEYQETSWQKVATGMDMFSSKWEMMSDETTTVKEELARRVMVDYGTPRPKNLIAKTRIKEYEEILDIFTQPNLFNILDSSSRMAMMYRAFELDQEKTFDKYLSMGGKVTDISIKEPKNILLHDLVLVCDSTRIKYLDKFQGQYDINALGRLNFTPLMWACAKNGNTDVVKWILDHNTIDILQRNSMNKNALDLAKEQDDEMMERNKESGGSQKEMLEKLLGINLGDTKVTGIGPNGGSITLGGTIQESGYPKATLKLLEDAYSKFSQDQIMKIESLKLPEDFGGDADLSNLDFDF